jgi:hypothetical protein
MGEVGWVLAGVERVGKGALIAGILVCDILTGMNWMSYDDGRG